MAQGSGALTLETALSWIARPDHAGRAASRPPARPRPRRAWPESTTSSRSATSTAASARPPLLPGLDGALRPDSPYWSRRDFSSAVGDIDAPGAAHRRLVRHLPALDARGLPGAAGGGEAPQLILGPWTHTSRGLHRREPARGHRLAARPPARRRPPAQRRPRARVPVRGARLARRCPTGRRRTPPRTSCTSTLAARSPPTRRAPPGPSRPASATTPPTRRPRSAARPCSSAPPCATTRRLEARPTSDLHRRPARRAPLTALGPVEADIRFRSSRELHRRLRARVRRRSRGTSRNVCDGLVRLTPDAPARAEDGVASVRFALWPAAHVFARRPPHPRPGLQRRAPALRAQPGHGRGPRARDPPGSRRPGGAPRPGAPVVGHAQRRALSPRPPERDLSLGPRPVAPAGRPA